MIRFYLFEKKRFMNIKDVMHIQVFVYLNIHPLMLFYDFELVLKDHKCEMMRSLISVFK